MLKEKNRSRYEWLETLLLHFLYLYFFFFNIAWSLTKMSSSLVLVLVLHCKGGQNLTA